MAPFSTIAVTALARASSEVNNIDKDDETNKLALSWSFGNARHLQANAGTKVATS